MCVFVLIGFRCFWLCWTAVKMNCCEKNNCLSLPFPFFPSLTPTTAFCSRPLHKLLNCFLSPLCLFYSRWANANDWVSRTPLSLVCDYWLVSAGCQVQSDALSLPDHLSARYQLSTEELRVRMNANRFREENGWVSGVWDKRRQGVSVLRFLTLYPVLMQPVFSVSHRHLCIA